MENPYQSPETDNGYSRPVEQKPPNYRGMHLTILLTSLASMMFVGLVAAIEMGFARTVGLNSLRSLIDPFAHCAFATSTICGCCIIVTMIHKIVKRQFLATIMNFYSLLALIFCGWWIYLYLAHTLKF